MAGRTIFILGNIKIFGIENTAEIGNVVETFNVPFKCTHNAWFVFHVSAFLWKQILCFWVDGQIVCVSGS